MKYFKLLFVAIAFLVGVTALILGGTYIYRHAEGKTLTDNDRKLTKGAYIKLQAGITHYELSGPDTGKVVILLNELSLPYYVWDGAFEYLTQNGYRVLRYDYYGSGYSDRPDSCYNNQFYINQLVQLIKVFNLKAPVTLAGLSFGGMLATDFTIKHPALIHKVILIDPGYETLQPDKPSLVVRYYEDIHPHERAENQLNDFKYPEKHVGWGLKYQAQMSYKGFINAFVSTLYHYKYNGVLNNQLLNNTHKPVLLIWGREDKTEPYTYNDSVRQVLKTEFFPVDDAAHLPHLEQPGLVNARILEFLKKP